MSKLFLILFLLNLWLKCTFSNLPVRFFGVAFQQDLMKKDTLCPHCVNVGNSDSQPHPYLLLFHTVYTSNSNFFVIHFQI